MNYKDIRTNDKMNKNVKEMLLLKNDNISLYALKRIEELENLNTKKLTKCSNCGKYIEMISTGEFCPNCKC